MFIQRIVFKVKLTCTEIRDFMYVLEVITIVLKQKYRTTLDIYLLHPQQQTYFQKEKLKMYYFVLFPSLEFWYASLLQDVVV